MHLLLADISIGTRLRVEGYSEESPYTAQLQRLGLVPGTLIELIRRAPLGDPLEIRLRGYSLALRPAEAGALLLAMVE